MRSLPPGLSMRANQVGSAASTRTVRHARFRGRVRGSSHRSLPDQFCDLPQTQWLAGLTGRARVVLKTAGYETRLHSLLAGDGMAYLPRFHGDEVPGLIQIVDTPTAAPVVDLWLAVQKDNRNIRRIRIIIDAIAEAVSGHLRAQTLHQRPDTSMQDPHPSDRRKPLATQGPIIHPKRMSMLSHQSEPRHCADPRPHKIQGLAQGLWQGVDRDHPVGLWSKDRVPCRDDGRH